MKYYVRTGSVNTTQIASSHKIAAARVIKKHKNFGKFILVGIYDLDDMSQCDSHMFFSTEHILDYNDQEESKQENCAESMMRLVY